MRVTVSQLRRIIKEAINLEKGPPAPYAPGHGLKAVTASSPKERLSNELKKFYVDRLNSDVLDQELPEDSLDMLHSRKNDLNRPDVLKALKALQLEETKSLKDLHAAIASSIECMENEKTGELKNRLMKIDTAARALAKEVNNK
jgi:hypothetical protein